MKECFKCKLTKPLSDFYKHSQMKDGHVNKCIDCNGKDVAAHRIKNIDKIRKYDRDRGNRQSSDYLKDYRKKFPNKYRATTMVNKAIRAGKRCMEPCEVCGLEPSVGHHDDYLKPLNVRGMCQPHHKQWHEKNGEGVNG